MVFARQNDLHLCARRVVSQNRQFLDEWFIFCRFFAHLIHFRGYSWNNSSPAFSTAQTPRGVRRPNANRILDVTVRTLDYPFPFPTGSPQAGGVVMTPDVHAT